MCDQVFKNNIRADAENAGEKAEAKVVQDLKKEEQEAKKKLVDVTSNLDLKELQEKIKDLEEISKYGDRREKRDMMLEI